MQSKKKFYKVNEKVYLKPYKKVGIVNELDIANLEAKVTYWAGKDDKRVEILKFWDLDKLENKPLPVKIKYFDDNMPRLEKITKGDWIDLRSAVDIELKQFEFALIPLGIAVELPAGYEAHIVPRSSTYKNFGVIQTNSVGVVDNNYKGDNDQYFFPALAMRDTKINKYDRICQLKIVKNMPPVYFAEVNSLGNEDRLGHGSTGVK